ncbi:MAG: CopK family periplasmic copper-binding protein [Rhodoferax sp.]|nr:CopK family periplasmic copper-binding protein [Rhodoferax sp.]MCP5290853.1 CopK family periplasmic copper-binding protein [Burkholderiaceae bacterium]
MGLSSSVFARDALQRAAQRVPALKDGSTLHAIEDGKMAEKNRFGRATYSRPCEVPEGVDGREVPGVGNEAGRSGDRAGSAFAGLEFNPRSDRSSIMAMIRSVSMAGMLALALAACAQNPAGPGGQDPAAHHPQGAAAAAAAPADRMAMMDAHMKAMREMHERMSRAGTPQERQALMAEHMKLMQEGMAMMEGMGPGAMGGMGMGGMRGAGPAGAAGAPMDMATRQQTMERRMEMMQSMMQMMMDRMGAPPART